MHPILLDIYYKKTSVTFIPIVPFGPHYGFRIEVNARPRSIQGNVAVIPKPLPMDEFNLIWEVTPQTDKDRLWMSSYIKASRVLNKQKKHTGIAIRGSPPKQLTNDIKFQGDLNRESIANGEQLAQSMLASDFFVLNTLGYIQSSHHKYTGRAQFP